MHTSCYTKERQLLEESSVNLPELYNTSKKDVIRGRKGDKEAKAEHRYIQAIVNKAYFDERINNYSQYALLDLKNTETDPILQEKWS